MNKKALIILVSLCFIVIVLLFFLGRDTSTTAETLPIKKIQSPVELLGEHPKGLKIEFSAEDLKSKIVSDMKSLSGDKILEQELKDKITKEVASIEDISSYSEKLKEAYQQEKSDFLNGIQEIEHTYKIINEWKSKNGKSLDSTEYLNPKIIFTLSLLSGNEISKQVEQGTDGLNLTTKDIYVIKTFSLSKDFNILQNQGRLNAKEITLEKLNMVYDNSPDVMNTSDGKVHGLPSTIPSEVPADSELDLEN